MDAHTFRCHARGAELFRIQLVNLLLSLVTLGVYSFWGRTRVRQYIWRSIEFEGARFQYHGTGRELFAGFLKIVFLLVGAVSASIVLQITIGGQRGQVISALFFYVIAVFLYPLMLAGAFRYRLSRTSYRGIRFSLRLETEAFLLFYLRKALLLLVSAGLYHPWFKAHIRNYVTGHAWFGDIPFESHAKGSALFGSFLRTGIMLLPTMGFSRFWWRAACQNHFWNSTSVQDARFCSNRNGMDLFALAFTNLILAFMTVGLGLAWNQVRSTRYYVESLWLEGALDLDGVVQRIQQAAAAGDALAVMEDTGVLDSGLEL